MSQGARRCWRLAFSNRSAAIMIDYPEVKPEFEALWLADGRLLFNGAYGKQIVIGKPPDFARPLVQLLDGKLNHQSLLVHHSLLGADPRRAAAFIGRLVELGIVAESLERSRPSTVSAELYNRFATEIAYLQRYERQGESAYTYFQRLRQASVTIIGAGGNGSLAAVMLAAAGVGRLHLIDGDAVDESNLVRQIFYTEADARNHRFKAEALASHINSLTRFTEVTTTLEYVDSQQQAEKLVAGASFVLLCADVPRFVINEWVDAACARHTVASLNAFSGIIGPFTIPGKTRCFACLSARFRELLGPLHDDIVTALQVRRTRQYPSFVTGPVYVAAKQVREVIGYLTGAYAPLTLNGILRYTNDGEVFEALALAPNCPRCVHPAAELVAESVC